LMTRHDLKVVMKKFCPNFAECETKSKIGSLTM